MAKRIEASERHRLLRRLQGHREHQPDGRAEDGHRPDRPVRLRQVDVPAVHQPDARGAARRPGRGHADHRRPEHLRPGRRRHRRPPHDRHGLPAPQPVPDHVDLRERGGRAPAQRGPQEGRSWTRRPRSRCARRTCGTRSRTGSTSRAPGLSGGQQQRLCIARTIAVEPQVRADGRAVLGAGPDLDAGDRGPDVRAEGPVHDHHRHAQHAAGGPGQRPDRASSRSTRPASRAG